jgi:hypothetical protein
MAFFLGLFAGSANAQTENAALNKQLGRIDLAISGIGLFSNTTDGTNNQKYASGAPEPLKAQPSNSFNGFGQLTYTGSKWFGLQFNYVHGRYTYNFTYLAPEPPPQSPASTYLGVQTNADEYSFGYIIHPHPTKFLKPFVSAGAGTISFAPTAGGGEGFQPQGRLVYFYDAGADAPISPNFGLRLQFRETFYLHPDYETTYLRDLTRSHTLEPAVGFYLRF